MPLQFYHDFESQQLEETQIMTWSLRSQHIEDPRDIIQLLIAEVQSYPGIWNKKSPAYKLAHKKKIIWEKKNVSKLGIGGKLFFILTFIMNIHLSFWIGIYSWIGNQ